MAITSAQQPIAIGIVRVDGVLMPITLITTNGFEVPPGKPEQTQVNGVAIGPVPFGPPDWPLTGRVWTLADGRKAPVEITTVGTQMVRMPYCDDRSLWRTTLTRPPAPEGISPIPKIGAAVSGANLQFPENVTGLPDAGSRRVSNRIVTLFLSHEKARLAADKALSATTEPVRIQQLARHTLGATSTYYFEATKAVKIPGYGVAEDARLLTGWIVDAGAGLKDYEVTYKINDDAYKENAQAIVRGIVPFQGRALWLLEWHGWESEVLHAPRMADRYRAPDRRRLPLLLNCTASRYRP